MARTKIDPMTRFDKKPITIQAVGAESVVSTNLSTAFMAEHGVTRSEAGLRFMDAHMELRITLKAEKASGLGWVTADEAEQIAAHMEAHASDPVPSIMKWL